MESVKCQECGLVNWADAETISCKRCGAPLWQKEESRLDYLSAHAGPPESGAILSGGIIGLIVILGLAVLALLAHRVLHLTDKETAAGIALLFFFGGLALLVLSHLWLVARVFEQGVWWGLGALFVPFVGVIALIMFWDKLKRSFIAQLLSLAIMGVGLLSGTGG